MRLAPALLGLPLVAAPPAFTLREAIQAEWRRQPPSFSEAEKAQLPAGDRARLERTLARIGAPGAPALLPGESEKPTLETWETKAAAAKTPQERFTALFFLNRLKSPRALAALEGLTAADAAAWPRHLHLEAGLATARLNGATVSTELKGFIEALQKSGKIDPVRAQAAQLRLVLAGLEKELLPPVKATPGSVLALMDAWNRGLASTKKRLVQAFPPGWAGDQLLPKLGLEIAGDLKPAVRDAWVQRYAEGQPSSYSGGMDAIDRLRGGAASNVPSVASTIWSSLGEFECCEAGDLAKTILSKNPPQKLGSLLPSLRKLHPGLADSLRTKLLSGPDPIARAAAIEDLPEAPADLEPLVRHLWKASEYDGVQVFLQSLERWKLPVETRKPLLMRFYGHPCWTARLDAWRELSKLEPASPWPQAPPPTAEDQAQLRLAERLADAGRPVRMRITFVGRRQVTLRLDPVNAPLNVANLVRLARKGFFNGRRVPRVVPDFVVQMGSPVDTMDGGPGYTVRCENSLDWYGPGSVGMALSGKDTGGSQFFITTNATPHLTGKYTRVGEVEDPDHALPLLDDLELGAEIQKVEILSTGKQP